MSMRNKRKFILILGIIVGIVVWTISHPQV